MVLVSGLNGVTRLAGVHDTDVGAELKGPYTLKVTVPLTTAAALVRVTVAVSEAELPRAIGVGATVVDIPAVGQVASIPSA